MGQITIKMTVATANALVHLGSKLYGCRAVECSNRAGVPLVWLCKTQYSVTTEVPWSDAVDAYTSFSRVAPGDKVDVGFSTPIAVDQTLTVNTSAGTGVVTLGGPAGAVGIYNSTTTLFTCGLATTTPAPFCAFPLHGKSIVAIKPLPKILLAFSTMHFTVGTAVGALYGSGVLINLADSPTRTVTFDINKGWSWDDGTWAQSVAANASVTPLLIQYSDDLAAAAAAMLARRAVPAADTRTDVIGDVREEPPRLHPTNPTWTRHVAPQARGRRDS